MGNGISYKSESFHENHKSGRKGTKFNTLLTPFELNNVTFAPMRSEIKYSMGGGFLSRLLACRGQ